MQHPTKEALLEFALGTATVADDLGRHLSACAECRGEVERLRAAGAGLTLEIATGRGSDCLDPAAVATLVEGTASGAARAAGLAHLARCSRCRTEVAEVSATLADPRVRSELLSVSRASTTRRLLRLAVPLAAAAALLLMVSQPVGAPLGQRHRATELPQSATPMPRAPIGAVPAAPTLTWQAVSGADRYRVTVFDASGGVILEEQVMDTALPLPDSVSFAPGETYLWKVEARSGWDRWVPSELVRFHVEAPRR